MKSNFITRLLLFQFLILFIYLRASTFDKSAKDFRSRILFYMQKATGVDKKILNMAIGDTTKYFQIFLGVIGTVACLAILNFRIAKFLSGHLTIIIAMLYCNPITYVTKHLKKNPHDWKNYFPSLEFLALAALGLGMMVSAFTSKKEKSEEDKKVKTE